jgi:hypothetical protein
MRPARRGIHHEWLWLTTDEAAARTPFIADSHAEFNPSISESTQRTLTDRSGGVKLIVYEKLTGATRAPVDVGVGAWVGRYAAIDVTFWLQVPLTYMLPSASSTSSGLKVVGISRYLQAAITWSTTKRGW